MSEESLKMRGMAAKHLRAARHAAGAEKRDELKRADAYKALAGNEEWLNGERQRSQRTTTKSADSNHR